MIDEVSLWLVTRNTSTLESHQQRYQLLMPITIGCFPDNIINIPSTNGRGFHGIMYQENERVFYKNELITRKSQRPVTHIIKSGIWEPVFDINPLEIRIGSRLCFGPLYVKRDDLNVGIEVTDISYTLINRIRHIP